MSDKPNRTKNEKTLGQMGHAISNSERSELRENERSLKAARIARNRANKKYGAK